MTFDSGGGASVSTFGGGAGGYAYLDSQGNIQRSTTPVTLVGQGINTATGQPNPSLVVDSATGQVLSGPGQGGYYNPTTNSVGSIPATPPSGTVTVPTGAGFATNLSSTDLLLLVLGGAAFVVILLILWKAK